MIPTFDLYNVIRGSVRVALSAITSPLGILLGVSAACGGLLALISNFAFSSFFPDFNLSEMFIFSDPSGILEVVFYCVNSSLIVQVFNSFVLFLLWVFPFILGFLGGVWAFMSVRSIIRAHRATIKDVVG